MSHCGKEVIWIRRMISELQGLVRDDTPPRPTNVMSDNTAAISMASVEQVSSRNKHIHVKYHHTKNLIVNDIIAIHYVPTTEQLADILTKPVDFQTLHKLRTSLCITEREMSKSVRNDNSRNKVR